MPDILDSQRNVFSRFGSWLSIAVQPETVTSGIAYGSSSPLGAGWYIRSHHARGVIQRELFKLEVEEKAVSFSPTRMHISQPGLTAEIVFTPEGGLRICGSGSLRLRMPNEDRFGVAYRDGVDRVCVNTRFAIRRYQFLRLSGELDLDAPWVEDACTQVDVLLTGDFDILMEEFWSTWTPPQQIPEFAEAKEEAAASFHSYLAPFEPPSPTPAWKEAQYCLWSSVVAPSGLLKRPAMFMSKNRMDQVWSWDHCFNAMALAPAHPQLAWDQWQLPYDYQDEHGALPDGFNDVFQHFNFCKPPVHGWAAKKLIEQTGTVPPTCHQQLARHTRWFLDHRRLPGHDLPYYLHGNDSGWDNSTMFDQGVPLISPDLATFLILQTDVLADTDLFLQAGCSPDELDTQTDWAAERDRLLNALVPECWNGSSFEAHRIQEDGSRSPVVCDSLIPMMPILLGDRLDRDILNTLAAGLERFITPWGVATEDPASVHYSDDGYWRGPVWGPSTALIVDGLRISGYPEPAEKIAQGFCASCEASGFYENFNALTGEGLRDLAYTWTASAYLLLLSA